MALHRLTDITLGVPNVEETVEYYTAFGLIPEPSDNENEHWFGTVDGGRMSAANRPCADPATAGARSRRR